MEYPGGAINLIGVSVVLLSDDLHLTVHDSFRWVLPSELIDMSLVPADVLIAKEMIRLYG